MALENQDGASRKNPNGNGPATSGPSASGAATSPRRGRPRSGIAHQAILEAARQQLIEVGYTRLRLEHVASRAGVGKATIYRRWASKEALALELLMELSSPHLAVPDLGDTRRELEAAVRNVIHALTATRFGPVIRAMMSQIGGNPVLGDPFRATVVRARRDEIGRVMQRGIERGDLLRDADVDLATELLVGPVYYRLIFGGEIVPGLEQRIVTVLLHGFGTRTGPRPLP